MRAHPVETKVKAAAGGVLVGNAIAGFLVWLCDTYWFTGDDPVPDPVTGLIFALVPLAVTLAAGYYAPHTARAGDVVDVDGRHERR